MGKTIKTQVIDNKGKIYPSISDACVKLKLSKNTVGNVLKKNGIYQNSEGVSISLMNSKGEPLFSGVKISKPIISTVLKNRKGNNEERSIKVIDNFGVVYPSLTAVSRTLGIHHTTLSDAFTTYGKYVMPNGIILKPFNKENGKMSLVTPGKGTKLQVVDQKGKHFESLAEACRVYGLNRKSIAKHIERQGSYDDGKISLTPLNMVKTRKEEVKNINSKLAQTETAVKRLEKIKDKEIQHIMATKAKELQMIEDEKDKEIAELKKEIDKAKDSDYENFLKTKTDKFILHKIKPGELPQGSHYVITLFSDAHIEETVDERSVLGLNKYTLDIARQRVDAYFRNLTNCLIKDNIKIVYLGCLGDIITGFIHEEYAEENGLTPPQAVMEAQNMILSGIQYMVEHIKGLQLTFIGICGNHSRVTKKVQASNNFKMSYEYILYHNLANIVTNILKLDNVKFEIPNAELYILETPDPDKKRYIFAHGYQIKGSGTGTVCGIYPSLQRLSMKWERTLHQDRIYIGHFHSYTSIPKAVVNGSIIGYNAFALNNGFEYEEPQQAYEVYDTKMGLLLTRPIYCK